MKKTQRLIEKPLPELELHNTIVHIYQMILFDYHMRQGLRGNKMLLDMHREADRIKKERKLTLVVLLAAFIGSWLGKLM